MEDDDAGHRFQREKEIFVEHQCEAKPSLAKSSHKVLMCRAPFAAECLMS